MADTRRASFRLGERTERKLEELARIAGSTRTDVVQKLISNRYAELHAVKESTNSVEADPAQLVLDESLSYEVGGDR